MVMTFIDTQEVPYYERVLAGIGKPFLEIIKHRNMAEIRIRSGKIKDFSALEAVIEQIQTGNYRNSFKRNQKKKKEDVSLLVQGQTGRGLNNAPSIQAQ